jgi:hypothetical protein
VDAPVTSLHLQIVGIAVEVLLSAHAISAPLSPDRRAVLWGLAGADLSSMTATGNWAQKAKIFKKVIATWMRDDYYDGFGETGEAATTNIGVGR